MDKLEAELKKVLTERDQVIVQLDKSQEMLVEAEDRVAREIQKARKKEDESEISSKMKIDELEQKIIVMLRLT